MFSIVYIIQLHHQEELGLPTKVNAQQTTIKQKYLCTVCKLNISVYSF